MHLFQRGDAQEHLLALIGSLRAPRLLDQSRAIRILPKQTWLISSPSGGPRHEAACALIPLPPPTPPNPQHICISLWSHNHHCHARRACLALTPQGSFIDAQIAHFKNTVIRPKSCVRLQRRAPQMGRLQVAERAACANSLLLDAENTHKPYWLCSTQVERPSCYQTHRSRMRHTGFQLHAGVANRPTRLIDNACAAPPSRAMLDRPRRGTKP